MPTLSESFRTERVMTAKSNINQSPTNTGFSNAITITFGDPATSSDGAISLDAGGIFTILDNTYEHQVDFTVAISRTGSGGIARLYTWLEVAVDGVNYSQPADSSTAYIELDSATTTIRQRANVTISKDFPVGTKIRARFARDESGTNAGNLTVKVPTGSFAGLNSEPSAQAYINRVVGD